VVRGARAASFTAWRTSWSDKTLQEQMIMRTGTEGTYFA
jgi:hypothetical protein